MSGDRQAREIACPETTSFSSVAGCSKSDFDDWCSRKVVRASRGASFGLVVKLVLSTFQPHVFPAAFQDTCFA